MSSIKWVNDNHNILNSNKQPAISYETYTITNMSREKIQNFQRMTNPPTPPHACGVYFILSILLVISQ